MRGLRCACEPRKRASAPWLRVCLARALQTPRCCSRQTVARRVTVTAVRHTRHALLPARSSLARGEVKLKLKWDLTFDMSGRLGPVQLAQGCPLDGGVRRLHAIRPE